MAVYLSQLMLDVPASSRAGSLPQYFVLAMDVGTTQIHCGSWPASDGGVSVSTDAGCAGLIASRL